MAKKKRERERAGVWTLGIPVRSGICWGGVGRSKSVSASLI